MEIVGLGQQGLRVSRLGLGCMGMSGTYGEADQVQAVRALQAALEEEVAFWDTADIYGGGRNEELLAPLLKGRREKVVLATKCGITGRNADGLTVNGRPDYIHKACEQSLRRLQTDYIDLYYLHRLDPDVPVEESVGAIGELVSKGLVKYVGLSEVSPATLARGHGEHPISALQSEYSLITRELEKEMLPALKELGIGLVAYSPLGRGLLTDKPLSSESLASQDFRRELPRFQDDNLRKNEKFAARVREVARRHGCTATQVALAWIWQRQPGVVPIPGTKRPEFIRQNAQALRIELGEADLEALDFSGVSGSRYPKSLASSVGI
ncbi:MAG: aldo/keto reductase [Candidatus Eremiobacteraeota bacterium]|nr:aldo/keto reductase [Candidatus Eremiobacteraeota bacterium]